MVDIETKLDLADILIEVCAGQIVEGMAKVKRDQGEIQDRAAERQASIQRGARPFGKRFGL